MNIWTASLKTFCDTYFSSGERIDWILVGSMGSVLQGADMIPNDIDIYTKTKEDVERFSKLFEAFQLQDICELPNHASNWLSSSKEPFYTQTFQSGFTWTKGRWNIDSFHIEVVNISNSTGIPDSEYGDGIWEGGKFIWGYAKYVDFYEYKIPLVPLEIQLESNLRRDRKDRVEAIVSALKKNGYDKDLLDKAISKKNQEYVKTCFK